MDPAKRTCAACSIRFTIDATTATPTATSRSRTETARAVHAAATRTMIGAAILPTHDWAACRATTSSNTRDERWTPNAVPPASASPSQIARSGRHRKRSAARRMRTPAASGRTTSSRGASVRARLSGSKNTDVATSTTSPDFGATRASTPAAITQAKYVRPSAPATVRIANHPRTITTSTIIARCHRSTVSRTADQSAA